MNRRRFLQTMAAAGPLLGQRGAKPNIVLILADDLGYGDVGFTGCPDIATPQIDSLQRDGVWFTHAYSNGAVCSPTRAALLTGQYQHRNGMGQVILVAERDKGLATQAVLLPQVLRNAGYATGIIGKWHLGFEAKYLPTRRGFDEFKGFLAGNIDYFTHRDRLDNRDLWDGERPLEDDRYMTDFIGDEAIRFIDRHKAHPFFLYLPFNAVHDPFQGPEDRDTAGNAEASRKKNRTRAVYKAMLESLDRNVGRILAHLDGAGIAENTVVFFLGDNGGIPQIGRNLPFRGSKGTLWEGGIRTPLVARWKGRFPAGRKAPDMVAGMDLFPTCSALAGAALPAGVRMDGVNLLDACMGTGRVQRDTLYFLHGKQEAMVSQGWKYLLDNEGEEHLFRLGEDAGETNDRKKQEPQRLASMKAAYAAWKTDVTRPASDDWEKVRRLRTGTELRIYKRGAAQPLAAEMDEADEERIIVVLRNAQTAIAKSEIDRIEARPKGGQSMTRETRTDTGPGFDPNAARPQAPGSRPSVPGGSSSSSVTFSRPGFETVYRRRAGQP
ncbi:MAG: sulfatase-like hydrolase/transferase [Bryobacterales bacterium]|nr:sulfatase-like hydrolase/transferase [Bryobacterales bacterium]